MGLSLRDKNPRIDDTLACHNRVLYLVLLSLTQPMPTPWPLRQGITVSCFNPAAVRSMLILRGFKFQDASALILENNGRGCRLTASAWEKVRLRGCYFHRTRPRSS